MYGDNPGGKMRLSILILLYLSGASALAANNPYDQSVQDCVKQEIQSQYPGRYSKYSKWDFTVRSDSMPTEFAYWIRFAPPSEEPSCFVEVREGKYSKADLQFGVYSPEFSTVDLQRCFLP